MMGSQPPKDEWDLALRAAQAPQPFDAGPNIPILGQPPKSRKRWKCPVCKAIVPAAAQMFQVPPLPPFHAPEVQILTILPGEVTPTFLCAYCDVRARRRLLPALEEIDEDDTVILPGLHVVPSDEPEDDIEETPLTEAEIEAAEEESRQAIAEVDRELS